jgi:DNA-binding response OmpR family regulator
MLDSKRAHGLSTPKVRPEPTPPFALRLPPRNTRADVTHRVLVVEDDPDIAHLVELHLRDLPCEVNVAHDGASGLDAAVVRSYDAIVLDIMLPRLDGLAVCRALRQQHIYTPVLMLTARSTELDRVVGLELGADDYLTKPFSVPELLARVKALFRRAAYSGRDAPLRETVLKLDELEIDVDRRAVSLAGSLVTLTAKEFDLLLCFASHPGRVYTRAQLLDVVWGYSHDGYGHTVNSHINRLRAKIESDPGKPRFVLTVWGVGYKFRDPSDV